MSSHHNSVPSVSGNVHSPLGDSLTTPELSVAQWVHELANLLDGSCRNLRMVMSTLCDSDQTQSTDSLKDDGIYQRLETVRVAMDQAATLVHHSLGRPNAVHFRNPCSATIGQVIRQAAQLSESGLPITLDIDDAVERLPAGPIYSVVTNALCNSVESLQSAGTSKSNDHPHIALSAGIEDGQLTLTIRDNGPGLDPALISDDGKFRFGQSTKVTGDGLGLSLSREIALSLGGCLDVQNHPQGGVATCLRYPLPSVAAVRG